MKKEINEMLEEVSREVSKFLKENKADNFGYLSYADGIVSRLSSEKNKVNWSTPSAKDELTDFGREVRSKKLIEAIITILDKFNVDTIIIKSKHLEYGAMITEVMYVEETAKQVSLQGKH